MTGEGRGLYSTTIEASAFTRFLQLCFALLCFAYTKATHSGYVGCKLCRKLLQ